MHLIEWRVVKKGFWFFTDNQCLPDFNWYILKNCRVISYPKSPFDFPNYHLFKCVSKKNLMPKIFPTCYNKHVYVVYQLEASSIIFKVSKRGVNCKTLSSSFWLGVLAHMGMLLLLFSKFVIFYPIQFKIDWWSRVKKRYSIFMLHKLEHLVRFAKLS